MECGGCEMSLEEFLALGSQEAWSWAWLRRHGVLRQSAACPRCGGEARLDAKRLRFRCRRTVSSQPVHARRYHVRRCEFVRSARQGTWCGNSTASLSQICRFCAVWLLAGGKSRAVHETAFSSETASRWLCYCREVLVGWAVRNARHVGGPGRVVEVESAPVRRGRLTASCSLRASWAVAGVEAGSGRAFLVPLQGRRRDQRPRAVAAALGGFVRPGSALASALWRARGRPPLAGVSFQPRTVDAERAWRQVLGGFAPHYRRHFRRLYVGHLAEFLFRRAFPPPQRLHAFFEQVGRLFPPPQ